MHKDSQNLLQEIDKALVHEMTQRHSYFQLKFFLIGKEPTTQAKMWQCLRELKTRRDTLKSLQLEQEDLKDKLEILNINSNRIEAKLALLRRDVAHDPLDIKEGEIELRRLVRQEAALRENIVNLAERERYTLEECRFFVETFKVLQKLEPLKPFDDIESQKEYWSARLSQKLNLKMLTRQNVDTELIETIMALPDEMDIKKQTLHTLTLKQHEIVHQLNETARKLEIQKGTKET